MRISISGERRRFAYTLIEVLVVISVIALLIALLLPAVQSAREASRRLQCTNDLKQIQLAIHNYCDAHIVIPPGRIWGGNANLPQPGTISGGYQNTPWAVLILPYLEQAPLANSYNFTLGAEGLSNSGFFANSTVAASKLGSFQCPSDESRAFRFSADFLSGALSGSAASRGNYAANWGNTIWIQVGLTVDHTGDFRQSPFGQLGGITFSAVTDGLSTTAFVSEILQGEEGDMRGIPWLALPGASSYMSGFPPNRFVNYYGLSKKGDVLMSPAVCVNDVAQMLPCFGDPTSSPSRSVTGSRSRHPGGVNVVFGDGSVHFVKDTIQPSVWIAANSTAGGEIISSDSY